MRGWTGTPLSSCVLAQRPELAQSLSHLPGGGKARGGARAGKVDAGRRTEPSAGRERARGWRGWGRTGCVSNDPGTALHAPHSLGWAG